MRRALLTSVVLLASAGAPATAAALTASEAKRAALSALAPQRVAGDNVVVFGLGRPLAARTSVVEAGVAGARARGVTRRTSVGRKAWLFWADHAYGAKFEHPSTLLLVDDRTGKSFKKKRMRRWPLVNGRDPAFIARRGRGDKRLRIYERIGKPDALSPPAANAAFGDLRAFGSSLPASAMAETCVIFLADRKGYGTDVRNMEAFWLGLGVPKDQMITSIPKASGSNGIAFDLQKFVPTLPAKCKDVVIYVNGHSGGGGVTTVGHSAVSDKNGKVTQTEQKIGPTHIAKVIRDNPGRTFKLIWDSCYSGNAVETLSKDMAPNLLVVVTSSNSNQYSWGWGQSAFTTGLITGMKRVEDQVAADMSGADVPARLIEMGLGQSSDPAAFLGLTSPQKLVQLPPYTTETPPPPPPPPGPGEPAPTIGKIQAELAAPITQYQVTVNASPGRAVEYAWSLQPPADDPGCKTFSQLAAPRYAEWRHSDADGCSHATTNHGGVVTVVAKVHWPEVPRTWTCTATYNGSASGFGPDPGPCQ